MGGAKQSRGVELSIVDVVELEKDGHGLAAPLVPSLLPVEVLTLLAAVTRHLTGTALLQSPFLPRPTTPAGTPQGQTRGADAFLTPPAPCLLAIVVGLRESQHVVHAAGSYGDCIEVFHTQTNCRIQELMLLGGCHKDGVEIFEQFVVHKASLWVEGNGNIVLAFTIAHQHTVVEEFRLREFIIYDFSHEEPGAGWCGSSCSLLILVLLPVSLD